MFYRKAIPEINFFEDDYEDLTMVAKELGTGTESVVLQYQDKAMKVLVDRIGINGLIKKLDKLYRLQDLEPYMTIPTELVYLEYSFIGYLMNYAGITLTEYVLKNKCSIDERIELLKRGKIALQKIHSHNLVHGDIQPKNILVDNGIVRISDINNIKMNKLDGMYLNEITLYLANYYKGSHVLDINSYNYITYLLLNLEGEDLEEFLTVGADGYALFCENVPENKMFEKSECDQQLDILINPSSYKNTAETKTKYLIDYLKK